MDFETWDRETLLKELKDIKKLCSSLPEEKRFDLLLKLSFNEKELHKKTDHELRCLYVQSKKHDDAFCRAYEENEERKRFFNKPSCNADFSYWAKQAYWSIDEAIALILGKDPRKVTWDNIKTYLSSSQFVKKFHELRELAKRYVHCKELYNSVFPSIFLAWAKRMQISIPKELNEAVSALGIQISDWKGCYDKKNEQYNQLNELYTQALKIISTKEKVIEELKLQVSDLEKNQKQVECEPFKETERKSVYKMLAAMAYGGYGYNPNENKSPIPKEVSDEVTRRLDEIIDPDTTRKWLKEATSMYPDKIHDKTE